MNIMKANKNRDWQIEVERYTKMSGISLFGYKSMYASNDYALYEAEGYKGRTWKRRTISNGVAPIQTKMVLSWIAKIFIDMKGMMKAVKEQAMTKQGYSTKDESKAYREWKEYFQSTGSVSQCPEYVYFLA